MLEVAEAQARIWASVRTGPAEWVTLADAAGRVLARVTRRSVAALGLAPGAPVHAVIKTVSVAPADIGGQPPSV